MTSEDRRNEQRRLLANWFNTVAAAVISIGIFVPAGQEIFGFLPESTDPTLITGVIPICFAGSLFLHLAGQ